MSHTETERSADLVRRRRDLLVGLVGREGRVLLVEPADDTLAAELQARGCEVAAGSADGDGLGHPDQTFDVVALPDVLSTYADPHAVLKNAVAALADGGRLVAVVPNAAHAARRLALLAGDSPESLGGTRGSARQLTKRSLCELLESAGLVPEELHGVVVDPLEADVPVRAAGLPDAVVEWVRHQPDALHESFVAVIRPRAADEDVAEPPRVHGDRPLAEARLVDEHTERAQALAEADYRQVDHPRRDHRAGGHHPARRVAA